MSGLRSGSLKPVLALYLRGQNAQSVPYATYTSDVNALDDVYHTMQTKILLVFTDKPK